MKYSKNTVIFAMLMSQITVFAFSSFMELVGKENYFKYFWLNISQTVILLVIPTLLILVIVFVGKETILRPINIVLICIPPVTGIVLKWTDRYDPLMRGDIYIIKGQLVVISTPFVLFIKLLELTIFLSVIVLLLSFYKEMNGLYKKQTITMAAGILIPFFASLIKIIKPNPDFNLPLISVAFTVTGIILFWSIFKQQLFSAVTVTRNQVIDSVKEGFITINDVGIVIDKNSAVDKFISDIFGKTVDLLGRRLEDFLINWPRWSLSCKNMQEDEFEIDTLKWGKKKYYYVKVYPLYKSDRKKKGAVFILIDITERKIREEKLLIKAELSQEQLKDLTGEVNKQKIQMEAIVNTVSGMAYLAVSDKAANFIYYSNGSKDIFSNNVRKMEEKMVNIRKRGLYFYQDGTEIGVEDLPIRRVLGGEKVVNFHFLMKTGDQDTHLIFNGTPIYDKSGNLTHGVYFILDVTDNIKHQQLVSIAEHLKELNALKDKLFTVFTHDIRNPMATMVSLIDLLEQDNELYNRDFMEILTEVKKQVNYTYSIIENLLEWLNGQRDGLVLKPCVWNLSDIVRETMGLYLISAGVKSIDISYKFDNKIKVYADKEILELVLRNLLSNAIKFTNQGGSILVEAYETKNETVISVKDTGIGMEEEKVRNLFQEGHASSTLGTAGEKGIGLGLLICKEFIMKEGGEIWAESKPGKGSTFYISLLTTNKIVK
jgi:signal transduction histidine kinase/PAS domain-containing protein